MLTGIFQTGGLLWIIIAFYVKDAVLIARYDRQRSAEGSGRSWDYTLVLLSLVMFMVVQPLVLPGISLIIRAWWGLLVQGTGLAIAFGGLALHWWARASLKQFYAERVEVQPDHSVIATGPYALVRHPVFTSFFLIVTGCFLLNPALPTLMVMAYAFWDFSRAARQEERLLSEKLPGYSEYMARTPAFFPDLEKVIGGK
jgi:protein-S-isoprenylcysteine O-methyltransferase Ste14